MSDISSDQQPMQILPDHDMLLPVEEAEAAVKTTIDYGIPDIPDAVLAEVENLEREYEAMSDADIIQILSENDYEFLKSFIENVGEDLKISEHADTKTNVLSDDSNVNSLSFGLGLGEPESVPSNTNSTSKFGEIEVKNCSVHKNVSQKTITNEPIDSCISNVQLTNEQTRLDTQLQPPDSNIQLEVIEINTEKLNSQRQVIVQENSDKDKPDDSQSETDKMDGQGSYMVGDSHTSVTFDEKETLNVESTYKRKGYADSLLKARLTFKNHESVYKDMSRTCKVCHKTCTSVMGLISHLRTHTGNSEETTQTCEVCHKSFTSAMGLLAHLHYHKSKSERPTPTHKCGKCGKLLNSKNILIEHLIVHSGRPYKCTKCNQTFKKARYLRVHLEGGKASLKCMVCKKNFSSNCAYRSHIKMHAEYSRFKCSVCDYSTRVKQYLQTHSVIHSGEKPFACQLCHKSFRLNVYVNRHLRAEHNQKLLGCKVCGKLFKWQSTLRLHLKEHTDVTNQNKLENSY